MYCSASGNRATSCNGAATINRTTSYNGAATINSASIAAASTILVVRIAVAAVIATAYNCPPSNDRPTSIHGGSPADCDAASMN
jgi:hypothetical protein